MSDTLPPELRDPIPLFPLQTVLYPAGLLPLRIFEPRYLDMVSESLRNETPFGIVPIKFGREVGATPHFYRVGTIATIESWDQGEDGLLNIQVSGGSLFRVTNHSIRVNRLLIGDIDYLDEPVDAVIPKEFEYLGGLLQELYENKLEHGPYKGWHMDRALWVGHRLAEVLPLDISDKVDILKTVAGIDKLSRIDAYLRQRKKNLPGSAG
ncbi:MAG: LON peptidase substrate-binding domain-containing protein [Gammaproteobacteria bacterium]|nr:LON peptidase substrate-binding domain-containing protein [Gammaproteobacteria bacterium]